MTELYQLNVNDTFFENTYPEVWKVTEVSVESHGMVGLNAVCVGYLSAQHNTDRIGEASFWGCSDAAYCPLVFKVGKFYTP